MELLSMGSGSQVSSCFATGVLVVIVLLLTSLLYMPMPGNGNRRRRRRRLLPPGPRPLPMVGSLFTMLRHSPRNKWVLRVAEGKAIVCINLAGTHVIVVNDPELARECLKKHDAAFASRPVGITAELVSRGYLSNIFSPMGAQWKKMRRMLVSTLLSPANVRQTAALRAEEADHLVRFLYNHSTGTPEPIDLRSAVAYCTGNIAKRILFGKRHLGPAGRFDGPGEVDLEYVEAAFAIASLIFSFEVSDYLPLLKRLDLDGHGKATKRAVNVIDKHCNPIIDARFDEWRCATPCTREPEDFLDMMLSLDGDDGKPLISKEEAKAQCVDVVLGVVDNPVNLVEWTMAEMLNQPEIMKRAVEELDRVVGKDRLVQEPDLPNLPYIKACIRETARLHPSFIFNPPHVALEDVVLGDHQRQQEYLIPKGSHLLLSRLGLGRNANVWPDPLRYEPERHIAAGYVEMAEPELRFISFSAGRRRCPAGNLGSLITYMLLARVLQAFEWSIPAGQQSIDLSWHKKSILLANPLHACARPRLPILLGQMQK